LWNESEEAMTDQKTTASEQIQKMIVVLVATNPAG
jgi:hypothetical protein